MASNGFKKVPKSNNARWDDPIKDDIIQITTKPRVLRYFPYLLELKTHFIEFMSESKGKTGFPALCVGWDPVKEEPSGRECPWCAEMKTVEDKKTGKTSEKPRFYQGSAFYGMAFDRGIQKKSKETIVGPVRMTKTLAEKMKTLPQSKYHPDMLEEEEIEKMGIDVNDLDTLPDVTDEVWGFNVTVFRTEKPGNKIDYECNPGDHAPLTKAEQAAFDAYESTHNIAKMAKGDIDGQKNSEIEKSLDRLRDKFLVQDGDVAAAPKKAKPAANARMERVPEDDDEDESPRTSLTGGTDDDDDDVPAPTPKAKKPVAPAPKTPTVAKNRYDVDDDDEDNGTQAMSSPDADDAPDDADDE